MADDLRRRIAERAYFMSRSFYWGWASDVIRWLAAEAIESEINRRAGTILIADEVDPYPTAGQADSVQLLAKKKPRPGLLSRLVHVAPRV